MQVAPDALPIEQETLAPKQVAARWGGCKTHTVLGFIKSGELEAFDISQNPNVGRPRWRIHRDAVLAFERRRSATAKHEAKRDLRRRRRQRRLRKSTRTSIAITLT